MELGTLQSKIKITDGENDIEIVSDGGQNKVQVKDMATSELLRQILLELRIMNIHLTEITDERVSEQDTQGV